MNSTTISSRSIEQVPVVPERLAQFMVKVVQNTCLHVDTEAEALSDSKRYDVEVELPAMEIPVEVQ